MYPTLKAHDNLCFPLRRAYLLLYVFILCKSQGDLHLSLFYFILWQAPRVGKILIYIYPIGCKLAWIIIIYTTLEVKVGRQHYKPLSFLVSDRNSKTISIAWVLAIVEDYMIVEYEKFAKSKLWHRPFLKIRWIAIVWWLRT